VPIVGPSSRSPGELKGPLVENQFAPVTFNIAESTTRRLVVSLFQVQNGFDSVRSKLKSQDSSTKQIKNSAEFFRSGIEDT
jgi:hypothetical protein